MITPTVLGMISIAGYNANMCQFRDIIIDKEKSFFSQNMWNYTTGANLRSSGTIGTCGYASRTGGSTSDFNGSSNAQYQHGDLFTASHGMTKSRWYNGNNLISSQNAYGNGDSQYGSGNTSVSGYSIHFRDPASLPSANTSGYNYTTNPYGSTLWTTLSTYNYYSHLQSNMVPYIKSGQVYAQGHFVNGIR